MLDIRHVREVQTLDYKLNTIKIQDKWKKDKEIQNFEPSKILVISYGVGFTLNNWILLCRQNINLAAHKYRIMHDIWRVLIVHLSCIDKDEICDKTLKMDRKKTQ